MPFAFSHRKATQALNFFARVAGGEINKMKALKLVYFADRYHLRRFGRPIIGDEYVAMNYGPVASSTKDIAEMSDFLSSEERLYAEQFVEPKAGRLAYVSKAPEDSAVFSQSDREALAWTWKHFGGFDQFKLADMTHAYPEWLRHAQSLESKSRAQMSYMDFLDDPSFGIEPCHNIDPETREAIAESIEERENIERCLQ